MTEEPLLSYLPNTVEQRVEMLKSIGVGSIDELFQDIPIQFRSPQINLPDPLSELDLRRELTHTGTLNADASNHACFLGAGFYSHFIPSVVGRIVSRGEFATSYTPYQPEVAQGTLQATYEFQSLICLLFGMEVANAGMYDGATALAEAALMACRVTGRNRILALDTISPTDYRVLQTYALPQGLIVESVPANTTKIPNDTACLLVQHPNFYGYLEDMKNLRNLTKSQEALLVMSMNPISMGMIKPPGDYDADIAVSEGQPLGISLNFGGPSVGLFTCKQQFLRQMPGRIVGRTTDTHGKTGYVLTLQTREQHIRRERATSNICTSEALMNLATASYLGALGPHGIRQVAELCYHKAHYLASQIASLPNFSLPISGNFFNEFVIQCPHPPSTINQKLLEEGIIGGLDISTQIPNGMLMCATEMNSHSQIDALIAVLREFS